MTGQASKKIIRDYSKTVLGPPDLPENVWVHPGIERKGGKRLPVTNDPEEYIEQLVLSGSDHEGDK